MLILRYAIEKTDKFNVKIIVILMMFILSIPSFYYMLNKIFASAPSLSRGNLFILSFQSNESFYYFTILILILSIIWFIYWKLIGNKLPKFMWIGILGWIFLGNEMITNLFLPGNWDFSSEQMYQYLPAEFLFGVRQSDYLYMKFIDSFGEIFSIESIGRFLNISTESHFINIIIYVITIILIIMIIYQIIISAHHNANTNNNDQGSVIKGIYHRIFSMNQRIPWFIREKMSLLIMIFIYVLSFSLFIILKNYFILLIIITTIGQYILIKHEIDSRGINHKVNTRSILFIFLSYMFALISGMLFYSIFVPLHAWANDASFNAYSLVIIMWTILTGSSVSVFIGLITQVIWDGSRLTQLINK